MTAFGQYPLYAVPDKHIAENRTSNTKISFLTVRRRQKIKGRMKKFLFHASFAWHLSA